jgi:hypothetical protein
MAILSLIEYQLLPILFKNLIIMLAPSNKLNNSIGVSVSKRYIKDTDALALLRMRSTAGILSYLLHYIEYKHL